MVELTKILFLDIETAPMQALVDQNDETMQHLWDEKMAKLNADNEEMTPEEHIQQAGLYAEFGRIVCISFGAYYKSKDSAEMRFCVSSFYGPNEKQVLEKFSEMLVKKRMSITHFCGHNAKEFDIPYIIRRMLILNVPVPDQLQLAEKKPWESPIYDTMEMWKCGAYRYSAQLKLLCAVLGVPSPKDDIDGSEVAGVFYNEKNYDRIATYCEKDVVATMQVHRRLTGNAIIDDSLITHLESQALL
ncbi:MAG: ribonuclease H-like domain-containing protein [Paludibacteraceae bacterium]|nr:ribonuclease H-like domain-containing protein [Paludibacteraceae bacterium]